MDSNSSYHKNFNIKYGDTILFHEGTARWFDGKFIRDKKNVYCILKFTGSNGWIPESMVRNKNDSSFFETKKYRLEILDNKIIFDGKVFIRQ